MSASDATHTEPARPIPWSAAMGRRSIFAATNALLYARHGHLVGRHVEEAGCLPDVALPRTYTERMLWRKLVDRDPRFVVFSDKLAAKAWSARRCPDLPLPRTLWVGEDPAAIPERLLRGDVVLKASHGSGWNRFVRGGKADREALVATGARWLRSVYGQEKGEWPYARVAPRLFVEESVADARAGLLDFQIRAAGGRAILGSVIGHNKTPEQWLVYLDLEGNPITGARDRVGTPPAMLPKAVRIREPYRRAVRFAERLSVGVDFARFDFLWNGRELFGGEITVFPASGARAYLNEAMEARILAGWDLRSTHLLRVRQSGWRRLYAAALRRALSGGGAQA